MDGKTEAHLSKETVQMEFEVCGIVLALDSRTKALLQIELALRRKRFEPSLEIFLQGFHGLALTAAVVLISRFSPQHWAITNRLMAWLE
jgi:hypothetical protein